MLAGLLLAEGGGQLLGGTTVRTADISAGTKTPLAMPESSATAKRCGTVSAPSRPATTSEP